MESCFCLLFRNNLFVQLEFKEIVFRGLLVISLSVQLQLERVFRANIYSCFNIHSKKNLFVQHLQLMYDKELFVRFFILVFIFFSSSFQGKFICSAAVSRKISGCFDEGSKHQNKPKGTEILFFCFHETNRNTTETGLVSVSFGSDRNFYFFNSRTP